jgi:Rieske Fe-S protein
MYVPSTISRTNTRQPALGAPNPRRRFIRYAVFATLGALLAQGAVAMSRILFPTEVKGFGTTIVAGTVSDIKVQLAGEKHVRNPEGRFYLLPAIADGAIACYWRCVHLGCTVPPPNPALEGNIQCPCHGSLSNGKNGGLIHGPATRSLDYFPMSVDKGNVVVNTGKIIRRQLFEPSQATSFG